MIAKARGKAASSATPPSTSQVSLPSQIGATEFIMMSRAASLGARRNRNAKIETFHQHIHEDAEPQDQCPQRHEIERHHGRGSAAIAVPEGTPAPAAARAGNGRCSPSAFATT
jgi:hypothetical protein